MKPPRRKPARSRHAAASRLSTSFFFNSVTRYLVRFSGRQGVPLPTVPGSYLAGNYHQPTPGASSPGHIIVGVVPFLSYIPLFFFFFFSLTSCTTFHFYFLFFPPSSVSRQYPSGNGAVGGWSDGWISGGWREVQEDGKGCEMLPAMLFWKEGDSLVHGACHGGCMVGKARPAAAMRCPWKSASSLSIHTIYIQSQSIYDAALDRSMSTSLAGPPFSHTARPATPTCRFRVRIPQHNMHLPSRPGTTKTHLAIKFTR